MFKRYLFLVLVVMLALVPVAQADVDTLFPLADYYPADVVAFGALRVDDATIDTLDAVGLEIANRITPLDPADFSLWGALDEIASDFEDGATYESLIGAWLGDTTAIGVFLTPEMVAEWEATDELDNLDDIEDFDNLDELALVWTIDITDAVAAEEFMAAVILDEGSIAIPSERNGFVVYEFVDVEYTVAIGENVAMGGTPEYVELMMNGDFGASLVDEDTFNETLEMFTQDDYAAVGYINQTAIVDIIAQSDIEDAEAIDFLGQYTGAQAVGLTMIGDRSFVVEAVQTGTASPYYIGAIDPDFAQRLPMSTPLLLHSTNLLGVYELAQMTTNQMIDLSAEDISEDVMAELNQAFTEFTGLDLEEDVLSWMSGDYAVFLDIRKELADATSIFAALVAFPLEFGVTIDSSADPAKANAMIDAIEALITKAAKELADDEFSTTEVVITREEIGRTNALVITVSDTEAGIPFPIELVMAANDEVFAFGTRESVRGMLLNDGGLPADPTYADAVVNAFVYEPTATAYISFPSLLRLVNLVGAASDEPTAAVVEEVLSLFTHWTASSANYDNGSATSRLTITLSEAE